MNVEEIFLEVIHQTPMRPKYYSYMFHCPVCNQIVRIGYSENKRERCRCGQKIDWSEEE